MAKIGKGAAHAKTMTLAIRLKNSEARARRITKLKNAAAAGASPMIRTRAPGIQPTKRLRSRLLVVPTAAEM
jgi:hypothetical protein